MSGRIGFVGTISSFPWGGSEILWSQAGEAMARNGCQVFANVRGWPQKRQPIDALRAAGVEVHERFAVQSSLQEKFLNRLRRVRAGSGSEMARWIAEKKLDLVCVSSGGVISLDILEAVLDCGLPVVSVAQAHSEQAWPVDDVADRWRAAWARCEACFFVSQANLRLAELQIAASIKNAEVVWNPYQVDREQAIEWPCKDVQQDCQLACVARLHPPSKGQDLLFQVLASDVWRSRPVTLNLYGAGPMERTLKELASYLNIAHMVRFHGHVPSVTDIWRENHLLVLPSRYEGLPLALVEAMFCGRATVATDVAGIKEVLQDKVTGFLASAPAVVPLAETLETAWQERKRWSEMGRMAQKQARIQVPCDPGAEFAKRLTALIQGSGR